MENTSNKVEKTKDGYIITTESEIITLLIVNREPIKKDYYKRNSKGQFTPIEPYTHQFLK